MRGESRGFYKLIKKCRKRRFTNTKTTTTTEEISPLS